MYRSIFTYYQTYSSATTNDIIASSSHTGKDQQEHFAESINYRSNFSDKGNAGGFSNSKAQRECFAERYDFSATNTSIRDEETGFGYFGARYMDHELMTMWLSVDPMADKYPGLSSYSYCAWNPVKLVDPAGMECGDYYTKAGKWVGTDNQQDGNVYLCTGKNAKGEFNDVKKLSITHGEFRKTAATVYGESSAYKYKVTSKN